MSELKRKSHNVSLLIYHAVFPIKYRKSIIDKDQQESMVNICESIEDRYEIKFIEVGCDKNHVHFLLQSIPMYSPKQIVQILKSIIGREMFRLHAEIKKDLWGGQYWSDGYFIGTVGQHSSEKVIKEYVKNQGLKETEYVVDPHKI